MKRYGKLIAGALGLAAAAVADGLVGPPWAGWVQLVVAAATLAGIYQAPYEPAHPSPAGGDDLSAP